MFVGDEWKWTVAILFWGLVLASPFIILGYIFYRNLFQAEVAKKTKKKLKKLPDTRIAKFQRFYYKHRIISVFLVIFVAWALVWLSQAAVERYNFYRVEKTMDAISQDINAKFNIISEKKTGLAVQETRLLEVVWAVVVFRTFMKFRQSKGKKRIYHKTLTN
ncbi:MAG TPA: hypothetical protein VFK11_00730 [Candidatus Saccharimonadales bacterium]|nr:hypothetical protein [Candidatus Saccharimonadales bacterium]